jgi:uncharacterized OB-fold protein
MRQPMSKPTPFVYDETRPFWDGTKKHELIIQKCKDCGKYQFYPRTMCSHCLSENIEWVKASGKGKLYSYTIAYRGSPAFSANGPYNIAVIELDEGVRMPGAVVDCKNEDLKCDMRVEVVFKDETPEFAIPYFKPIK